MTTIIATITIRRGDTFSQALLDLGVITNYTHLDFTVKEAKGDLDSEAIIHIRKSASGLKDGLLVLNGETGTASEGSITIDDAPSGDITIALAAGATEHLDRAVLFYDVQKIVGTTVTTMGEGICIIEADIGRAIV